MRRGWRLTLGLATPTSNPNAQTPTLNTDANPNQDAHCYPNSYPCVPPRPPLSSACFINSRGRKLCRRQHREIRDQEPGRARRKRGFVAVSFRRNSSAAAKLPDSSEPARNFSGIFSANADFAGYSHTIKVFIRFKFSAQQTMFHSPSTFL